MFYNTLIKIYSNLDPNSYIKSIYTDVQPYLKSIMFEDGFEINITKRVFCDIENSINIHSYIEIENEKYKVMDIKKWDSYMEVYLYKLKRQV